MASAAQTCAPHRFRATVGFYGRYRLAYPEPLTHRVAELAGLKSGRKVLDLGCEPSLLAIPFVQIGMRVTAVDSGPGKLAAARDAMANSRIRVDLR